MSASCGHLTTKVAELFAWPAAALFLLFYLYPLTTFTARTTYQPSSRPAELTVNSMAKLLISILT